MFWKFLLFVYSLRFAICFGSFVLHNRRDSTIELSRHGLFRNSIHKFSISNFHLLKNDWENMPPLLMLSVERSKSLDLPYSILMDMKTEYICLVARKQKSLPIHTNRVVFQMDFQTKSLVTSGSWDVWTTIDRHSNKTRLVEGDISNRNKTELAIAMTLSSDNNGSISYNLDFALYLADSEADEGLYKFSLHNCDNVPLSFKVWWLTDPETNVKLWLWSYISGRMFPSGLLRALFLLLAVIEYLSFCGMTSSALINEYFESIAPVLLVFLLIDFPLIFYVAKQVLKRYDNDSLIVFHYLLWYLGTYSYYNYVVSFDLVLQLMVANDLPFHFAWIQFLIEDVLTIACLILSVYAIKQVEHVMVSEKNNKYIFSSEKALNLTVAIIV